MEIHNYVRPLWQDGPHVVHDAPVEIRTAFDALFKGRPPGKRSDDLVQLHRVGPLDLTVAWLQVEVEMPIRGTDFSYRRARYLHAIGVPGQDGRDLSPKRARALFEDVYGADVVGGIHEAQRRLSDLPYAREGEAREDIFVTGQRRPPKPTRPAESAEGPFVASPGPLMESHQPLVQSAEPLTPIRTAMPTMTASGAARSAEAERSQPVVSEADVQGCFAHDPPEDDKTIGLTPVQAFDRAYAARGSQSQAAPAEAPRGETREAHPRGTDTTEEIELVHPHERDSERDDTAVASLSALLHGRLSESTVDDA